MKLPDLFRCGISFILLVLLRNGGSALNQREYDGLKASTEANSRGHRQRRAIHNDGDGEHRKTSSDLTRHPFESINNDSHLCYSEHAERLEMLHGSFQYIQYRTARYWNLSCPIELSKQSCSHFGHNITHATSAANLHFIPSQCTLLSRENMLPHLALRTTKRVVCIGNSLMRQVLTGLICDMHVMGLVDKIEVDWHSCSEDDHYPCHGTLNCITCGPHSGYKNIAVRLIGGTTFEFVDGYEVEKAIGHDPNRIDLVVAQEWHMERVGMTAYWHFLQNNSMPVPKLIWMQSYNAHFRAGGGLYYEHAGKYNETALKELRAHNGSMSCLQSAGRDASLISDDLFRLWPVDGFLWLQGINELGDAKVGNSVGIYGDCQHFCEPGPADEISRALLQLMLTLFREE
jgi:hypothetical protein